jgi:hypothetical protein
VAPRGRRSAAWVAGPECGRRPLGQRDAFPAPSSAYGSKAINGRSWAALGQTGLPNFGRAHIIGSALQRVASTGHRVAAAQGGECMAHVPCMGRVAAKLAGKVNAQKLRTASKVRLRCQPLNKISC